MKGLPGGMMIAQDFLAYYLTPDEDGYTRLDWMRESLAEAEAEFCSEAAMFGDGPPGSALVLKARRQQLAKVVRQIERLKGGA